MDVKEVVKAAKDYITDVFADEGISEVGLEEVEFDLVSRDWKITIGFVRGWDWAPFRSQTHPMYQHNFLASAQKERRPPRYYKVLRIDNNSGDVKSLKDRMLNDLA